MESAEFADPLALLASARAGDKEALGSLTGLYRNYLQLLARVQIDRHLHRRLSPSDLVQETLMRAVHHFGQFRGESEKELLAWLRKILVNALRSSVEREIRASRRDLRREVSLTAFLAGLDKSCEQWERALISCGSSPSNRAMRREEAAVIANQLAALPLQYREVIVLRNLEGIRFEEIAVRMGRSVNAVRILWTRALRRLQDDASQDDVS